jgi:dihydropteroate synthase
VGRRNDAYRQTFGQTYGRALARRGAMVMGVCNVTPDSFSDGGRYFSLEAACARVDALVAEGADVVDIGGESTRPGAPAVDAREQLARVLDVVRYAAKAACVSIDTSDPAVAAACLDAGASIVNDVSCLRDEELARVVASSGAAFVLMHARGTQAEMRGFSRYADDAYGDVVRDVVAEWNDAADRAARAGVAREALVMDPGLGFAKNARQSAELLRRLDEVVAGVRAPVLVGASRKSFLTLADPSAPPVERIGASIAAALAAVGRGATAVRVHDVRATCQAIDTARLLASAPPLIEQSA